MKPFFKYTLASCLLTLLFPISFAQETEDLEPLVLKANISAEKFVPVGSKVDFSAEGSTVFDFENGVPRYLWNLGEGDSIKWGKDVFYYYQKPGRYPVELRIKQGNDNSTQDMYITAYNRRGLLIADADTEYDSLVSQAGEHGIWLEPVVFGGDSSDFSKDANFSQKLAEKIITLENADFIIFQTQTGAAFQSFAQWWQKRPEEEKFALNQKNWIQISEQSLEKTEKLIHAAFNILEPGNIIVTRQSALNTIFKTKPDQLRRELSRRGIEFLVMDGKGKAPFILPFSRLSNYFISKGISQNVIYFFFAVPFIVFVISFFRQFIGISTFGVFAPMLLSLSFMLLGLNFGLMIFIIVMIVSYLIRLLFAKVELLYIPRVSLLFSVLSIAFFFVLGIAVYLDTTIDLALAVFPIMVMSTVSEKFISAQSEGGLKSAFISAAETVIVSILAYGLVQWSWLQNHILGLPELILLPILGNIWLGRFTGLRVSEYFKFWALFRGDEEQE